MRVKKKRILRIGNLMRLNWAEFFKSPKLFFLVFTYICIAERCFFPMLQLSKEIDEYMNIYEPFINFCNSDVESILIPIVFLVLFCDFPKANSHYTFTLVRCGRRNWLFANVLFAGCASFLYLGGVFLVSVLVCQSRCFVLNGWSMYTRKMRFYYQTQLYAAGEDKVIPPGLYMHYRPLQAFGITILLNVLLAMFMACICLLCNVLQKKDWAMMINVLLLIAGWVTNLFKVNGMWALPYGNSKIGWHNRFMLKEKVISDGYSIAYFVILTLILYIILFRMIRKTPIYVSDNL